MSSFQNEDRNDINPKMLDQQIAQLQQHNFKIDGFFDGQTPATVAMTSDLENMTLDASPKYNLLDKNLESIQDDIIEDQDPEENKSKLQKYQSFKIPKESLRKNTKNRTFQPQQTLTNQQSQSIQDSIQEGSTPQSQDTPHSSHEQTLKHIKELWNKTETIQQSPSSGSPSQLFSNKSNSLKNIPSETEYFQNLMLEQSLNQVLSTPQMYYPLEPKVFLNSQGASPYLLHEGSPQQFYIETDIENDKYISGLVDQLWGNQIISRKLQKLLETGTDEQKELIVQKLERVSPQIQKDIFGNYVAQKIFEHCNQRSQLRMFNKLKTHFYDLSKNTFGCRVMQKLIEYTNKKEELQLIVLTQLQPNIRSLVYDVNGNYVIFKLLEIYDKSKMEYLIPIIEDCFQYMSQQIHGCKIIHKIISTYSSAKISRLVSLAVQNYNSLCQTEYGNHILQHILQYWVPCQEKSMLVQLVMQQMYQLSTSKYASNTVERAIEILQNRELYGVMQWLLCRSPNSFNFVVLANHQYANYVIKRFLIRNDPQILRIMADYLNQNPLEYQSIRSTVHGLRISSLLEKQLQK